MAAALMRRLHLSRRGGGELHRGRGAVEAVGAHAWIFRGSDHEDRFIEFIEWSDSSASPLHDGVVTAALDQLDAFAMATHSEEWEETQ